MLRWKVQARFVTSITRLCVIFVFTTGAKQTYPQSCMLLLNYKGTRAGAKDPPSLVKINRDRPACRIIKLDDFFRWIYMSINFIAH